MSDENKQAWRSDVRVIALDTERAAVLFCEQANGLYSLPSFEVEGGMWEATTAKVQELVAEHLDFDGQLLYRVQYQEDEAICRGEAVFIMETAEPEKVSGEWIKLDGLSDIQLIQPELCPLIETALTELETGMVPEKRPPWARPGWYGQAAEWMRTAVQEAGWRPVGPTEPVRSWALSCLMKLQGENGREEEKEWFFFKSSLDLPLFVNEAVVTKTLANMYPGHVPDPIALDEQKNWMLLEDFGPVIGHGALLEDRLEILRQFAQVQKDSVDKVDQLIAAGCCDRRLDWMLNEIEPFVNKPKIADSITAEEAEKLRGLVRPLEALCRKLYEYAVPDTIIHGDLHGSNVARNDKEPGKLLFFDWTDAAVSHPFFDMLLIYTCKDPVEQEAMRDLYLAQWLDYEPMERLLELWQMAKVTAAVYHGLSYVFIGEGLEVWAKSDMDWAMPYWLRKILEYSEELYE